MEEVEITKRIGVTWKTDSMNTKTIIRKSYLSIGPRDFVYDICEDDILIISFNTHPFPLHVVSHSYIVTHKGMCHTVKKMLD